VRDLRLLEIYSKSRAWGHGSFVFAIYLRFRVGFMQWFSGYQQFVIVYLVIGGLSFAVYKYFFDHRIWTLSRDERRKLMRARNHPWILAITPIGIVVTEIWLAMSS